MVPCIDHLLLCVKRESINFVVSSQHFSTAMHGVSIASNGVSAGNMVDILLLVIVILQTSIKNQSELSSITKHETVCTITHLIELFSLAVVRIHDRLHDGA